MKVVATVEIWLKYLGYRFSIPLDNERQKVFFDCLKAFSDAYKPAYYEDLNIRIWSVATYEPETPEEIEAELDKERKHLK